MRHQKIFSFGFGLWLAGCASEVPTPEESWRDDAPEIGLSAEALAPTDFFVLRNEKSKRCIGVDNASKEPGARIMQFDCDCKSNQQWAPDVDRIVIKDHRALINGKSGLCIGVDGGKTTANTALMQFKCDQKANQQWKLENAGENELGEGTIRFKRANLNLCIGVDGGKTGNGVALKQFTCDSSLNQRWTVQYPEFCSL